MRELCYIQIPVIRETQSVVVWVHLFWYLVRLNLFVIVRIHKTLFYYVLFCLS